MKAFFKLNMKLSIWFICLAFLSCVSEPIEIDNLKLEGDTVSNLKSKSFQSANITISLLESKPISPLIYGVNNDWRRISEEQYNTFANLLGDINYQVIRFPGGFESEFYDWSENRTPKWRNRPETPGASIATVKESRPNAISIVLPTVEAMNVQFGSPQYLVGLELMKNEAIEAINITGADNITSIEIGNEWWLQFGGGVPREAKLFKYANIAKDIASHIRLFFPTEDFKILVNGDYTQPDEFRTINQVLVDSNSLQHIDGLALHTYTGYESASHNIRDLQMNITACKENLGKGYLSLSEWAPSKLYNESKIYAEGANLLVEQMFEHAWAQADEAAFWPPTNPAIPGLGLFNFALTLKYPTAQLFGDMAMDFRGSVLNTETDGTMRVVAAQKDNNEVVVYVVGKDQPYTKIELNIDNNQAFDVISSSRWEPGDLGNTSRAIPMNKIENVEFKQIAGNRSVRFDVNKNSTYTIYKMVLQLR